MWYVHYLLFIHIAICFRLLLPLSIILYLRLASLYIRLIPFANFSNTAMSHVNHRVIEAFTIYLYPLVKCLLIYLTYRSSLLKNNWKIKVRRIYGSVLSDRFTFYSIKRNRHFAEETLYQLLGSGFLYSIIFCLLLMVGACALLL